MRVPRVLTAGVALVMIVALAACTGSGGDSEKSFEQLAQKTLGVMSGVVEVEAHQTPVDGTDADRADADRWSVDINVVMSPDATTGEFASAAGMTHTFSKDHAGTAGWTARVSIGAGDPAPVQLEVYPTVHGSAVDDARAVMTIRALPGVDRVVIASGIADVRVLTSQHLLAVIDHLRSLAIWQEGGNLQADNGRIRLSDVPERVTTRQLEAIISAGIDHPDADLALESSGRSPELYMNHLTVTEARTVAARFTEPGLTSRSADGFVLEFNLRAIDSDRAVDTHGTFGERA